MTLTSKSKVGGIILHASKLGWQEGIRPTYSVSNCGLHTKSHSPCFCKQSFIRQNHVHLIRCYLQFLWGCCSQMEVAVKAIHCLQNLEYLCIYSSFLDRFTGFKPMEMPNRAHDSSKPIGGSLYYCTSTEMNVCDRT